MTYTNYTTNSYYSMKQKEIGAVTVSEFVLMGISPARIPNLTHLASTEAHFSCKEEHAGRKGRPPLSKIGGFSAAATPRLPDQPAKLVPFHAGANNREYQTKITFALFQPNSLELSDGFGRSHFSARV